MPKVVYRSADGSSRTIDVAVGTTLMQAAMSEGVQGIIAECGGNAMCATCHVYVDPDRLDSLPPMQAEENDMLDCAVSTREPNSRLSCQLTVSEEFEGLEVDVPEDQA